MSAKVVQLKQPFRPTLGWSSRELGEFYRVEAVLIQAGLRVDTESGISDEGDPWFAFCRGGDGEVIVHIARIEGVYLLASPSYEGIASGSDISMLVRELVARHPLIQMPGRNKGANIFLHPAALLIAIVATAFFKTTEARALTDSHRSEPRGGGAAARQEVVLVGETQKTVLMDAAQSAVILSAIAEAIQSEPPAMASSNSDLIDYSAARTPAQLASADTTPLALEVAQDFDARPSEVLADAPVAVEAIADALPLITLLWDLAKTPSETTVKVDGVGGFLVVAAESTGYSATAQPVILAVTIGLPSGPDAVLPTIQFAKISFAGTSGGVETHTLSQPDQLPAALIKALQSSTHSIIEVQPGNPVNTSFATALIDSLMSVSVDLQSTDLPTTSPITEPLATASNVSGLSTVGTAVNDSPTSLPHNVTDVQKFVQDFIGSVSEWVIFEAGKSVVIYDAVAVTTKPGELTSVTFDFSDRSALSLVGLPADLHQSLFA